MVFGDDGDPGAGINNRVVTNAVPAATTHASNADIR
jgi:hypothetical protein